MSNPALPINRHDLAGVQRGDHTLIGEFARYKVFAVHTRDGTDHWMVTDAERVDDIGLPAVIRQGQTREEVVAGLDG